MKKLLIFIFVLGLTNTYAQTPTDKTDEEGSELNETFQNETSVIVGVKVSTGALATKTAYFLNGQFIKYTLLVSSNPERIESLNVIYDPIEIDSVKYERQIHLVATNNYFPKAISLTSLKDKYFPGLNKEPVIFTIDGKIANGDYETYEIDENNLYAITSGNGNIEDKIKFQVIELTTKSEASIKNFKSGSIWRKGNGMMLMK